jgi:hypothetical protein
MSDLKFNIGDEAVVNDKVSDKYWSGFTGIIETKTQYGWQLNIDGNIVSFRDNEIDLKYSFSKDEVISSLNEIYNSHGEQYEYTILVKKITFPMSALQVKNKFGSVLLDQLLLSGSEEA